MRDARLQDGVPVTAGWFVVNARETRWLRNQMRALARFGGGGEAHFDQLGIGLFWLEPDSETSPADAYGAFGEPRPVPAPDIF